MAVLLFDEWRHHDRVGEGLLFVEVVWGEAMSKLSGWTRAIILAAIVFLAFYFGRLVESDPQERLLLALLKIFPDGMTSVVVQDLLGWLAWFGLVVIMIYGVRWILAGFKAGASNGPDA